MDAAIGQGDHVSIVEGRRAGSFDQTGADRQPASARQFDEAPGTRPIRHRLRELTQLFPGEVTDEPVSGKTAFWKDNQLHTLSGGASRERL